MLVVDGSLLSVVGSVLFTILPISQFYVEQFSELRKFNLTSAALPPGLSTNLAAHYDMSSFDDTNDANIIWRDKSGNRKNTTFMTGSFVTASNVAGITSSILA